MKRVGIFAGTFDPVHKGHTGFALAALKEGGLDKVVFLPEKSPRAKAGTTKFADRLEMLRLATKDHPKLEVLEIPDNRFTVAKTLPKIQKLFSDNELVLLIGSDVAKTLPEWQGIDELLGSVSLAVGLRGAHQKADLAHLKAKAILIVGPHPKISAGKVRSGEAENSLSPRVRDYIHHNQLYK